MEESQSNLAWEELRTEHIIQDRWIDFRKTAYRLPNGAEFEPFYTYTRKDYVIIVATDTAGNYVCVRQFRQGIREVTTEFPAGGIEGKDRTEGERKNEAQDEAQNEGQSKPSIIVPGSATVEEALLTAKRELSEETGYESDEWRFLLKVASNATIADNYAYIFEAKNCRRVTGQHLDDTECLQVTTHTEAQIEEKIAKGEFQQAMHILAYLYTKR